MYAENVRLTERINATATTAVMNGGIKRTEQPKKTYSSDAAGHNLRVGHLMLRKDSLELLKDQRGLTSSEEFELGEVYKELNTLSSLTEPMPPEALIPSC